MKRKIKVNFPDGFEFPEKFDDEHCSGGFYNRSCPFYSHDLYDSFSRCILSPLEGTCPFYNSNSKDVIKIKNRAQAAAARGAAKRYENRKEK